MTELPRDSEARDMTGGAGDSEAAREDPERRTRPATPRWVKVFGIVLAVVLLLLVILLLTKGPGGGHGPGQHGGLAGYTWQQGTAG